MDPRYYAITTKGYPNVDNPALVCRRWTDQDGIVHEESFSDELAWRPSLTLSKIESGEWPGEIHLVSEEAGRAFEAIKYARLHEFDPPDGKYEYFALVEQGKAVLAIRTWVSPQGYHLEETHTPSGWLRSHVQSKVERSSSAGDLVPITREEAEAL